MKAIETRYAGYRFRSRLEALDGGWAYSGQAAVEAALSARFEHGERP